MRVGGNLTVAAGATYQVQVEGPGADQMQAGGTATLSGGTVAASLIGYNPVLGHAYPIVTATGGVTGTFAAATADNLPFIRPVLSYDANDVFLTLARSGVPYAGVATSPNQTAVANAIDAGPAASGLGAALAVQSAAGAQRAFDALSGEIHASAQTAMLDDSLHVREALLGRMRQATFAGGIGATAALATGGPTTMAYAQVSGASLAPSVASAPAYADGERRAAPVKVSAVPATAFWTQGVGSWGRLGGDGNAAGARRTLAGFFSGVDGRFGRDGWPALPEATPARRTPSATGRTRPRSTPRISPATRRSAPGRGTCAPPRQGASARSAPAARSPFQALPTAQPPATARPRRRCSARRAVA